MLLLDTYNEFGRLLHGYTHMHNLNARLPLSINKYPPVRKPHLSSSYPGWIKSPHVVTLGILKLSDLDSLTIFNLGGRGGYSGVSFGHPKSEVFRNGVGGVGGLSGLQFQKGAFWKIWTKIYCSAKNLLVHYSSLSHTTYVETNKHCQSQHKQCKSLAMEEPIIQWPAGV